MTRSTKKKPKRTANPGGLLSVLATHKYETRLLGAVQTHMLARNERPQDEDDVRDPGVLHPSEICKSDWCPRQSAYRLMQEPESDPQSKTASHVLENIWDEGHEVGRKWQDRLHAMGVLRGQWRCRHCRCIWTGVSPQQCPGCGCPSVKYLEVPIGMPQYLIGGRADGDVVEGGAIEDDPLIEVKTIGMGTLRFEAPGLIAAHTFRGVNEKEEERGVVDGDRLWQDIKRPFPSHIRQGTIYGLAAGRKHVVFIYECKWNQQTKEFVVRVREDNVAGILDGCKDVVYALKSGRLPSRPGWAELGCKACQECPYRTTCWDGARGTDSENDASEEQPLGHSDRNRRRHLGGTGEEGSSAPAEAEARRGRGRAAEAPPTGVRLVRRRSDEPVRRSDSLD